MAWSAREILGVIVTALGLGLLAYAFIVGAYYHEIGAGRTITPDAWAAILGWFLVIIGPAIWFGETPASIKEKAGKG